MNTAFLLTGGNTGDRRGFLAKARTAVEGRCGHLIAASSVYETAAWGKEDQAPFLNQVLQVQTTLSPEKLLQTILNIEADLGRLRTEKYGPRTIDIDILLYNDCIVDTPTLTIPHPQLQNRRFVLEPLAELAPQFVHPVLQCSVLELLAQCTDKLGVQKMAPAV